MRERTQRKRIWVTGIYILLFLSTPLSAQMASPLQGNVETTIESAATIDTGGELTPDGKKIVKGFVSDEHGESIIGATVVVKGHPETGTVTDVDGKFTLEVEPRSILVISYIGYNPQETRVSRKTPFYNIILKEDNQLLEEVVVVGYGTVKKSDLTGSVSTVGTRSFESQPVTNVSQILQGRTSGVEVTSTSGMPGSGAKVRIRGTTSINKSSDPLYVIDGIISSSGLDGLNPQDIQSMEILKDASSTAIYGSRGANGVILVTTRSGEEGRARVTFNAKIGLSSVRKDYDLLNAYEYAQALRHPWFADHLSRRYGSLPQWYKRYQLARFNDPYCIKPRL